MKEKKLRELSDEELEKVHGGLVLDECEKNEYGYCVIEYDSPSPILPGDGPTAF